MSDDLFEKAQRRQKVEAEGILDQKRFDLATPEAEMTLHEGVQEARRFMKRYPEVIGMGVYGSFMKGYAAPHSDIDFCLFIDFRQVKGWLRAKTLLGGFRVLGEEFAERFQKQVTKNSRIPTQKVSCDFVLLHQGWVGQMLFDDRMQEMAMLFLPTIGTEVKAYRRDLITKLESVPYGPGIWKTMMEVLWKLESHGFSEEFKEARKKLYPFDLEHAREYFRID